jgi:hypothetical protein
MVAAVTAAAFPFAWCAAAALAGIHSFEPAWERVVTGALPMPGAMRIDAQPTSVRGSFTDDDGVLRAASPPAIGDSTWVTSVLIEDGLVRARLVVGDRLDASILVRAAVDADGELDSGYAISIEKGGLLKLYRYVHRNPRALGAEAKIDGTLAKGSVLELVVLLNGPFIDATVLDGVSFEPRARAVARDRAFARGAVGVRFARGQDVHGGVSLLAVGTGPHELSAIDDGAGPERMMSVAPAQEELLPADLRFRVIERRGNALVLITDANGLERARRAGVVPLAVTAEVPFKYVEPSLRARLGEPPTPTLGGFRVDESYKDADGVEAILRAYAARFANIARLEELGRSLENRPILALKISRNPEEDEDEPAVLLDGGHHGGELMSTELALDAMQQLLERYRRDAATTRLVDHLAIWIVPLVNPDGNMRFVHVSRDHDRKNARDVDDNGKPDATDGVDLYRNYPVRFGALGEVGSRSWPFAGKYRGPASASEPEVQAMMRLAARERFTASIDFHTSATMILVPYTDPGMTNPEPNEAWTIAEEMAAALPTQVNAKRYTVERNMYAVDGTAQDWLRFSFGTVALLVEGPTNNPLPYAKGRPAHVAGTRPTWQLLCARVLDGPGVHGRVRDADGAPIEAEIVVDELKPRMGEVWTARPRDGRFHRLFPSTGTFSIRVRALGYEDVVRKVTLDGVRTATLDVTLTRGAPVDEGSRVR